MVSREMAPFWGAGIGTYVASMARAWVGAGHEVHVLGVNDAEAVTKGARLFPGVRFHAVDPLGEADERILWRSDVARRSQQVRRALARLHAAHRFEYIEFPEYFAEGALAIRGARLLGELQGATLGVRLHSPDRLCRELNADPVLGLNRLLTDQLEEESISEADVVISPTESLLTWCQERATREGLGKAQAVVPYPFDAGEFLRSCGIEPGPLRSSPETLGVEPEILYFGRLERRKGVDLLIDAFGMLVARGVRCTLRLVGGDTRTGPGGASMREHLVMRLGSGARERVSFEDQRPRAELGAIIRACARSGGVCCFPSRWENFPNAVLEAMALGATVVCSNAGGMAEIVEDGVSGLLFEAGDAEALSRALERGLRDRALRERVGVAARERIHALCDPAAVVEQTLRIVRSAGTDMGAGSGVGRVPGSVPEVVIDQPGAAREIDSLMTQAGGDPDACVLVRAAGVRVDPRLAVAGARAIRADRRVRLVTAHVTGSGPAESWLPLGLNADALCVADLSGLCAAGVVRVSSIRASGMESVCASYGIGGDGLSWVLGASMCGLGRVAEVIPEPWIQDDRARDPFALTGAGMHRKRMVASGIAAPHARDATRLLASVLGR